jgi:hypothetical protein
MDRQNLSFEFKCNQKWGQMQQVNGEKLCQHCNTFVFDLTKNSKKEIIDQLKKNNNSLCGQFFMDQINESEQNHQPLHLKIVLASIVAFLTLSVTKASAQTKDSIKTELHDHLQPTAFSHADSVAMASDIRIKEDIFAPLGKDEKRKKAFMRIGRRSFYTSNKFPFITSRK